MERLKYHFEPRRGWINDPNGLVFFKGRYHAFCQHYPHDPKWGPMHWGHAVSDDLIHWEELPIALFPDKSYEFGGGCWSGSAIIKDDRLFLFYTSVSHEFGQTQSMAYTDDGVTFTKFEGNPIIKHYPPEGSSDFRDPKVTFIDGKYHMVCGSGKDGVGKILHYTSDDIFNWTYEGVLYQDARHGNVLECPDFFKMDDVYVLMFSQMGRATHSIAFIVGDFDGKTIIPRTITSPEAGPHFYAPQTFADATGRRIVIGWLNSWERKAEGDTTYMGAFTLPRELIVKDNKVRLLPVKEAESLLAPWDPMVHITSHEITLDTDYHVPLSYSSADGITDVKILKDTNTIEVFINNGEASFTYWFGK